MAYRIELTKSAVKELERLPAKTHDKVVEHLFQLEQDPRVFGSEKLTGVDAYKLRVGSYRIVYEIDDAKEIVRVVMVDDRKQVYQRLRRRK
ncbi:MAG TPA: type II toxin-antitoxin system RelE/ParE family toxin [Pyrinomonadaceae bacterium]|nr:type II toxin-antitoxin system RelE/ParE family toxin [Pyrinomonadaceae bacterium]